MSETQNIHKVMNSFDKAFGRKRLNLTLSCINDCHIYLQALYEKDTEMTAQNQWPQHKNNPFYENGVKTNQYVMLRIWFHDKNENSEPIGGIRKDPEYVLTLWKDNIYVNGYTMSDYKLATDFYEARNQWVTCKADLIAGSYQIDLGPSLMHQLKEKCTERLERLNTDLGCILEGKPLVHSYLYESKTIQGRIKEMRQEINAMMRIYEWLLGQPDKKGKNT